MRVPSSVRKGVFDVWPWLRRELLANCNVKQQLWESRDAVCRRYPSVSAGRVSSTVAGVLRGRRS